MDSKVPVIGFIGRLEEQKGSDILAAAISEFMDEEVQIIVLVSNEEVLQTDLRKTTEQFLQTIRTVIFLSRLVCLILKEGSTFLEYVGCDNYLQPLLLNLVQKQL